MCGQYLAKSLGVQRLSRPSRSMHLPPILPMCYASLQNPINPDLGLIKNLVEFFAV